jgi:transposase
VRRHRYPGRRPIDDRAALAGIVFVLKTGIAWNQLPTAMVGCSGRLKPAGRAVPWRRVPYKPRYVRSCVSMRVISACASKPR